MKIKIGLKKVFTALFVVFVLGITYAPSLVQAQTSSQPCLVGGVDFKKQFGGLFDWVPSQYCNASTFAVWIIGILLQFSGVVAVLSLIVGGFFYLTSAGNEEQAEKARKIITNSVIGLIVIIMSTAIVTIVSNLVTTGK